MVVGEESPRERVRMGVQEAAEALTRIEDPLDAWRETRGVLEELADASVAISQLRLAVVLRVWMGAGQPPIARLAELLDCSPTYAHRLLRAARTDGATGRGAS